MDSMNTPDIRFVLEALLSEPEVRRLVPQEVTAAAKLGEGRQKASLLPAYPPRAEKATAMVRSRGVFVGAHSSCTPPPPLPSSEGQQRPVGTSE
ncbi:hypothetical protein IscW_ISCW022793 [Ixodes scapularis]|uniref:Uncharacterized protein n=1 Tax=Ixodes scapularis TaxID=6945 RepID=B7QCR4_IXOSC|nr:hypothetical protein IscW_ISCW022793 [Ixodes scapularis]|eukprot:XP_002413328.1 hypothetical protein IscW_ISCW022793 [Ixodes scapularis]